MDGYEIHPVLSVPLDRFKEIVGGHFYHGTVLLAGHLDSRLVYGDGSHRHGGSLHDGLARLIDPRPRGQVHNRVRSRLDGRPHFLQFFFDVVVVHGSAHVGVHLGAQPFADGQRSDVPVFYILGDHRGSLG